MGNIRINRIFLWQTVYNTGAWKRLWEILSLKRSEIIWNACEDVLLNTLKVWKLGLWRAKTGGGGGTRTIFDGGAVLE